MNENEETQQEPVEDKVVAEKKKYEFKPPIDWDMEFDDNGKRCF